MTENGMDDIMVAEEKMSSSPDNSAEGEGVSRKRKVELAILLLGSLILIILLWVAAGGFKGKTEPFWNPEITLVESGQEFEMSVHLIHGYWQEFGQYPESMEQELDPDIYSYEAGNGDGFVLKATFPDSIYSFDSSTGVIAREVAQ